MVNEVLSAQAEVIVALLKFIKSNRRVVKYAFATLVVYYFIVLILFGLKYFRPEEILLSQDTIRTLLLAPVILIILLANAFALMANPRDAAELKHIIDERKELNAKIEKKEEPNIFDTLRLNLNHISEYYTINKSQAKRSFFFSLAAIVIGLITIIVGVFLYYTNSQQHVSLAFLTGVSGILLEFIGGAYFFMYKKSLEQVNFFFGQLIKVQDTMLAINLAENISDEVRKTHMKEKIIDSLLERSLK